MAERNRRSGRSRCGHVLEVFEFAKDDGVAEMEIGRDGIDQR